MCDPNFAEKEQMYYPKNKPKSKKTELLTEGEKELDPAEEESTFADEKREQRKNRL